MYELPGIEVTAKTINDVENEKVLDFRIDRCEIVSADRSGLEVSQERLDFKDIILELNYYEDIFTNGIYGNILINDSYSYHNKLSWCGDEFLILRLTKPFYDTQDDTNTIKGIFRVYKPDNRYLSNPQNENYTIHFCSEEIFLSQRIIVGKTYKNKKISEIVVDICLNYLKIPPDKLGSFVNGNYSNIEETFDKVDITINNMTPIQAISWLCTQAISNKMGLAGGATYLFWKNRYGWHFKSILSILDDISGNIYPIASSFPPKTYYWYGAKNVSNVSGDQRNSLQILSYDIENTHNSVERTNRGMFNTKLISIDYLRRTHDEVIFDYDTYFKNFLLQKVEIYKNYQSNSLLSTAQDRFKKKNNDYPDTIVKIFPSTTNQKNNPYIKKNQPDIKSNYCENTLPYRFAQLALINYNKIRMTIPGDPNISIGNIIYIKTPQPGLNKDLNQKVYDRFMSGYYLVTALRHKVNVRNQFTTILEVVKDSYYNEKDIDDGAKVGLTPFPNSDYYVKAAQDDYSIFDIPNG